MRLDTLQTAFNDLAEADQIALVRSIRANRLVNKRAAAKLKTLIREAQALDVQEKEALSKLLAGTTN